MTNRYKYNDYDDYCKKYDIEKNDEDKEKHESNRKTFNDEFDKLALRTKNVLNDAIQSSIIKDATNTKILDMFDYLNRTWKPLSDEEIINIRKSLSRY